MRQLKGLTENNLKAMIESRGYNVADVQQLLGVTQQQIYKYFNGQNEMSIKSIVKLAKYLNCKVIDLYPDLDLSGNTSFLGFKGEKRKLLNQTNNTNSELEIDKKEQHKFVHNKYQNNRDYSEHKIVIKNYGIFNVFQDIFASITISNFLTLNSKIIKLLLVIVAILTFINYYMYNNVIFNPDLDYNIKLKALVDFLDLHIISLGLVLGLCLPLLIQWWLAYIPLFLGLNTLSFLIAKAITNKALIGTHTANIVVHLVSLIIVIIYAIIIRKIKNKKQS
jgi:transcriptional regulator with XRE-family HTH domain